MSEPTVLQELADPGVIRITLNRPTKYNALSEDLLFELHTVLKSLSSDDSIRVVILRGAGPAFCAGHDLKEMRTQPDESRYQNLFRLCSSVMLSMIDLPQPIIAEVTGKATAAGCQLVANSDLAVASTNATFAVSGINLGLFCSTPSVALSRNLSRKHAFKMLMTGRFIDAHTAVKYGLINDAVPSDQLDSTVRSLARDIASKPQSSVREGKALFYAQLEQTLADAYENAGKIMAHNMMFEDTKEGIDAFIEKRTPNWKFD
ncbi:MAG: enoyl-CoA hydratase [Acidiferrobacteraceae bacterium]|nr:enoyl-CoA hydratase [Acidiferrobacteraceae bacterium]